MGDASSETPTAPTESLDLKAKNDQKPEEPTKDMLAGATTSDAIQTTEGHSVLKEPVVDRTEVNSSIVQPPTVDAMVDAPKGEAETGSSNTAAQKNEAADSLPTQGWGWGGWANSLTSVMTSLSEEAAKAAAEVSKTAAAAAKGVVESFDDPGLQENEKAEVPKSNEKGFSPEKPESIPKDATEKPEDVEVPKVETVEGKKRAAALERLEKASQDSVLGHGLKVFDNSVESLTAGAFQALGTAWKGGLTIVNKLEHGAGSIAVKLQEPGALMKAGTELAPALFERGLELTVKAGKAIEVVGKEAMGLLAEEAGMDLETEGAEDNDDDYQDSTANEEEEVSFERCFYIYGGPDHLEELEELASHHSLVCSRARAKLSDEERTAFDALLKQVQQMLSFGKVGEEGEGEAEAEAEAEGSQVLDKGKGKEVEIDDGGAAKELEKLQEASIKKAVDLSSGFASTLPGLAVAEAVDRTLERMEQMKAEGIHRLAELCAVCVLHLLQLGKSALAAAGGSGRSSSADVAQEATKAATSSAWPDGCLDKALLICAKTRAMIKDINAVDSAFLTGIRDVAAAFEATSPAAPKDGEGDDAVRKALLKKSTVEDKTSALVSDIKADGKLAVSQLHTGLQHLAYVILTTSIKH